LKVFLDLRAEAAPSSTSRARGEDRISDGVGGQAVAGCVRRRGLHHDSEIFPEEKGGKYEQLSDRRNIVVVADEAHRSQYDFIDGFARHMRDALPNASFIGFTGTPIERDDRSPPHVFGEYIDKYDIQRAVEDGATVPIF